MKNTGCIAHKQREDPFTRFTYRTEEHPIEISFRGIKFEGKPTSVSHTVCGTLLTPNRRQAREQLCLLANFAQKCCTSNVSDIMRNFKFAVGSCCLSVNKPILS
jgi:hypothetical protein